MKRGEISRERQWQANAGSVSCTVGVRMEVTQQECVLEGLPLASVEGNRQGHEEKQGGGMRSLQFHRAHP